MKSVLDLQREFLHDTGVLVDASSIRKYIGMGIIKMNDDLTIPKRRLALINVGIKPRYVMSVSHEVVGQRLSEIERLIKYLSK